MNRTEDVLRATIEQYSPVGQGKSILTDLTGISSSKDVYYWQTRDTIYIQFGKFNLPLEKELVLTDKIKDMLNQLDINIYGDPNNKILIKYKGEIINEVVK